MGESEVMSLESEQAISAALDEIYSLLGGIHQAYWFLRDAPDKYKGEPIQRIRRYQRRAYKASVGVVDLLEPVVQKLKESLTSAWVDRQALAGTEQHGSTP